MINKWKKNIYLCSKRFRVPNYKKNLLIWLSWLLFRILYNWFSHDVTKIRTTNLLIFLRFNLNDVSEQLKTNIHANFRSEWVLGFVIHYAWISKLLRDAAFAWRPRELSWWLKKSLISGNLAIWTVHVLEKVLF